MGLIAFLWSRLWWVQRQKEKIYCHIQETLVHWCFISLNNTQILLFQVRGLSKPFYILPLISSSSCSCYFLIEQMPVGKTCPPLHRAQCVALEMSPLNILPLQEKFLCQFELLGKGTDVAGCTLVLASPCSPLCWLPYSVFKAYPG